MATMLRLFRDRLRLMALSACLCCALTSVLMAGLPPRPSTTKTLTFDEANILSDEAKQTIHDLQVTAFNDHDTPIVVVTIHRMNAYLTEAMPIEMFARLWFDTWQIGKKGSNKGALLLVSLEDRKARIELGADWGRKWDQYCQYVMDSKVVPEFKKADYSGGVLAGVQGICAMAAKGPSADPPEAGLFEQLFSHPTLKRLNQHNPIPRAYSPWILALGVVCIILGLIWPKARKPLLILGITLVVSVLFFWLLIGIIAFFRRGKGSFAGGGGAFSGGFSGGGGASGSW